MQYRLHLETVDTTVETTKLKPDEFSSENLSNGNRDLVHRIQTRSSG